MELPGGRVVIELAPDFAPRHAANIRTLVKEHYFDGLVVLRSHDNYVAQWGDADEKNPRPLGSAQPKLAPEFTVPMSNDKHFVRLPDHDGYAPQVGHSNGFPVGRDPKTKTTWLAHCYGMVGVGRDMAADSGNGTSLYAVNGHAPRHLDRNVTVVGRVVSGMPLLSSLPRGTGPLGFYEKPEQNVPIKSIRLAADVPEAERSHLEVMRSDAASFKAVAESQRNRPGPWTKVPAGYIELCNVTIPVREQAR
jgi:peptidylprolyl isomerase